MRVKGLDEERIQQYITEALLILMAHQPYEKITISKIAEKAGVNRSSYYRHFDTREDIIRYYFMGLMTAYKTAYEKQPNPSFRSYLLTIFTTFYAHKKELLIIHKNGLSHLLLDVLDQCFKFDAFQGKIGSAQPFKAAYHIGGIYHNLLLWMNHGMQETPKQMCSIALSFMPEDSFSLLNVQ